MKGPAEVTWFFFTWTILILFWGAMRGQPLFNLTKYALCITQFCHNTNWRQKVAADPAPHHSLLGNSVCWKCRCKMTQPQRFMELSSCFSTHSNASCTSGQEENSSKPSLYVSSLPRPKPSCIHLSEQPFHGGFFAAPELQSWQCKAVILQRQPWLCPWTPSVAPRRHSLNSTQWHFGALWDIYFWKIWYCQQPSEVVSRLLCLLLKFLSFLRA